MNRLRSKDKASHKIGLYVRVSTEEQASNPEGSIKSQEQRLRQHIDIRNLEGAFGEVAAVFIDRGRSGKDTNRPELQRLLMAIRGKTVTLVMVTELSRLSRSIKDFSEIWELMRTNGCGFQSLREAFDTTTAAGEMVLFTLANLAQFERQQTSERIVANFAARAERGLFNGGSIPLGYRRHPEKKGYLVVDEEEATTVRVAFQTFLSEGSLAKAGRSLNDRGFRLPRRRQCGGDHARLGYFTIENLYKMLINPMYAGKRTYRTNSETKTVKAVWDAIVPENTFSTVQKILKQNYRRHKPASSKRHPYQLSGILYCAKCGDRLCGKSAHGNGGKIPYYEHAWSTRRQSCLNKKVFACIPNRVLAKTVEKYVWERMETLLSEPELAASLLEQARREHESQAHVTEMDRLRNKVRGIEEQIEALAEHLAKIPKGLSPAPIFAQMQRLESMKSDSQKELEEMERSGFCTDVPAGLKDYRAYLSALKSLMGLSDSPELRSKIIKWLVAKIELLPTSFKIHYFVGKSVIVPVDWNPQGPTPPASPVGKPKAHVGADALPAPSTPSHLFLNFGSKTLTTGYLQ